MLGRILGGLIGARTAKYEGMDQGGGALIGALAIPLMRRFGLPGMIAAAAGGYALKKYNERRLAPDPSQKTGASPTVRPGAT
ncbi:MAG: hypothetical protein ABIT09_04655 [Croceibacterium sp.]